MQSNAPYKSNFLTVFEREFRTWLSVQEPVEPHRQTVGLAQLSGDTEPQDPSGLSAQGVVSRLLAVYDQSCGDKVHGSLVRAGYGIKDQAATGLCSPVETARGKDPLLLRNVNFQWCRRRVKQQGQGHQP